jgi:hypothetical protein
LGLYCVHSPLPLTACRVTIIIDFFFANARARQRGNRDKYEVSITAIASYFDIAAWVWIPVFYIDIDLRGVGRKAAREGTVVNIMLEEIRHVMQSYQQIRDSGRYI